MDFLKETEQIFTCVTRDEQRKLHELAEKSKIGVEIGSYLGASSIAIASSAINKLYCVDVWKSNPKMRPDPANGKTLLENFKENTKNYKNKIEIVQEYSKDAITYFLDNNIQIDFLFIDGDHSSESVKKDWSLYKKILKQNGIVVFHDWSWGSVKQVITEVVAKETKSHQNLPNMWWARKK